VNTSPPRQICAVVPIKDFSGGKKRLAAALSSQERIDLIVAMARDVLAALTACREIDKILIVSGDRAVERFAREEQVQFLLQESSAGLNPAITEAAKYLTSQGIQTMLAIHGDVPLLHPAALTEFISSASASPSLTIAPSNDDDGSNLMLCTPPNVIPFHYGAASFTRHRQAAEDADINARVFKDLTLGLDIDTPSDLKSFITHGASINHGTHTMRFLTSSGIAGRLTKTESRNS
jgi:2-phospho-L-lactate guanylyltransferase